MTNLAMLNEPIIIVGCPRSGTTLLRTMLENHPELLVHPDEPQFILGLFQRFGLKIRNVSEAVAFTSGHPYFPGSIDKVAFKAAFNGIRSISLRSFLYEYLRIWGGDSLEGRLPVIKHPELIYHLNLVSSLFSESTILHIVRDPRSNVLSQRNRWPQYSVWDCSMAWKMAVRTARTWAVQHPSRFVEIKYEDLVMHPNIALTDLLRELGLPFISRVLTIEYTSTIYSQGQPVRSVVYNKTDPTRVDLWRTGLSPVEISLVEFGCAPEMELLQYQSHHPRVSLLKLTLLIITQAVRHWILRAGRWIKTIGRQIGWRTGFLPR